MLPALPARIPVSLDDAISRLSREGAALGVGIHRLVLDEIARFMVRVNSYYTNAMEGNPSTLKDIEAALENRLAKDRVARNYQIEHLAHIEVEEAMFQRLRTVPGLEICSSDFLRWIHTEFYRRLPDELRKTKTVSGKVVEVQPGEFRDRGIRVGVHDAPERMEEITGWLEQFSSLLEPGNLKGRQQLLGLACSHHRFLWIHPFPDGNGRVARLLTNAYAYKIGLADPLLWTVSRAFARRRAEYDGHLAAADQPRRNDLDGRGPLSEENLISYCEFFFECALDQVRFMSQQLQLPGFIQRFRAHLFGLMASGELSEGAAKAMERIAMSGEIPRAEVLSIAGVKQRRATQIIRELLEKKLARSLSSYGPLRLNLSVETGRVLFPELA